MTETINIIDHNITRYKRFEFKLIHHSEEVYNKLEEKMAEDNNSEYIIKKLYEFDKIAVEIDTEDLDQNVDSDVFGINGSNVYAYIYYKVEYLTNYGNIYGGYYNGKKIYNDSPFEKIGKIYSCNGNKILEKEQIDLIITKNFNYIWDINREPCFIRNNIEKEFQIFLKTGEHLEILKKKKKITTKKKRVCRT
jgi:hypothetical protein